MHFKPFQKDGYARAALRPGLILADEQGLGKTFAAFTIPLLWLGWDRGHGSDLNPRGRILIVAPADLHGQIIAEGARHFGIKVNSQFSILNSQCLSPGFYITHPHALAAARSQPSTHILSTSLSASWDCVVVDEGTDMKGATTQIGLAIRSLAPRYRLVLTGTPIKNRLPDLFFLLWWVAGGLPHPHPLFPFGPNDQAVFAKRFLMSQRKVGPRAYERGYTSLSNDICNLPGLWRVIAPLLLRRTKREVAPDLPPKHEHIIRIPMSPEQASEYQAILTSDAHISAKLQALRIATSVAGAVSEFPTPTPKLLAALETLHRIVAQGDQAVVFSAFHAPLDALSALLGSTGYQVCPIPHEVIDGRIPAVRRSQESLRFRQGEFPIILCGAESCARGNNWPNANHVLLLDDSWAWDRGVQAIDRVHRLDSTRDVHVYRFMTEGSVDEVIHHNLADKGSSTNSVIDPIFGDDDEEPLTASGILEAMELHK